MKMAVVLAVTVVGVLRHGQRFLTLRADGRLGDVGIGDWARLRTCLSLPWSLHRELKRNCQ